MAGYPGLGGVLLNPGALSGVDLSRADIQYRPGGGVASIRVPKSGATPGGTPVSSSQSASESAAWSGVSPEQAAQREVWRDTALKRLESVAGGQAQPYDPQTVQRMQAAAADQAGQAAAQQAAQMRAQAASAGVGAQDPAMRDAMREAAAQRLDQVQQANRGIDMRATEANFNAQQQAASALGGMQFHSGSRSTTQTTQYDMRPDAPSLYGPQMPRQKPRITGYTPTAMGFIPGNAWGAQQTRRWHLGY